MHERLLVSRLRVSVNCGKKCMLSESRTRALDEDVEFQSGRMSRVELVRTVPLGLITVLVRDRLGNSCLKLNPVWGDEAWDRSSDLTSSQYGTATAVVGGFLFGGEAWSFPDRAGKPDLEALVGQGRMAGNKGARADKRALTERRTG
ncbi:hypothetical protein PF003_g26138 [Phytophthora fragariae]|nr:hypothetical protein PF003_g26138 [Phytophthora fragariae]